MAMTSFFALIVLALTSLAFGLEFEMQTSTKCIFEEINANALVVGDYKLFHTNYPDHGIFGHIRVVDPYGATIHQSDHKTEGQFAFTATTPGEYEACFTVQDQATAITTKILLDWKTGVAATDWNNIAKKEHLDDLSVALRKLEDNIREVYNEMLALQEREEAMREISENTNFRVAWYSVGSLLVCVLSGAYQVWHLRKFFRRKKLM